MKRWAITRIGDYENDGSRVPKIILYTSTIRMWSKPGLNWGFCQFAAGDLTAINADADIYVLPDGAMDMSVGSIPAGVRKTMRTRLEAAGFTFTDVKTSWTVRQLLNHIANQVQLGSVTVESGDVQDVAG